MKRPIESYVGELLLGCTVMHNIVGVAYYRDALVRMAAHGLLNVVHDAPEYEATFWFFVVGLFYGLFGLLFRWFRREDVRPPSFLGIALMCLSLVGLFLAPTPGWPFIAVAGGLALRASRPKASAA